MNSCCASILNHLEHPYGHRSPGPLFPKNWKLVSGSKARLIAPNRMPVAFHRALSAFFPGFRRGFEARRPQVMWGSPMLLPSTSALSVPLTAAELSKSCRRAASSALSNASAFRKGGSKASEEVREIGYIGTFRIGSGSCYPLTILRLTNMDMENHPSKKQFYLPSGVNSTSM